MVKYNRGTHSGSQRTYFGTKSQKGGAAMIIESNKSLIKYLAGMVNTMPKMFEQHGFRYSSDLFETDRFKRLIIPHNKKNLQVVSTKMAEGLDTTTDRTIISDSGVDGAIVTQTTSATGTDFSYSGGVWTYTGTITKTFRINAYVTGDYYSTIDTIRFEIRKNGIAESFIWPFLIPTFGTVDNDYSYPSWDFEVTLATGDTVDLYMKIANDVGTYRGRTSFVLFRIYNLTPTFVDATIGGTITMNDVMPQQVRQIDFFTSIVKLFNLYVYEDRFDNNLLYIKPFVDFYSTDPVDAVDWSYKLNRDKTIKIKPMSELNAKVYNFKWKPDDDYWNRL